MTRTYSDEVGPFYTMDTVMEEAQRCLPLLGCTMFCGMSCRNRSCKIYPERAFPQFKGGSRDDSGK